MDKICPVMRSECIGEDCFAFSIKVIDPSYKIDKIQFMYNKNDGLKTKVHSINKGRKIIKTCNHLNNSIEEMEKEKEVDEMLENVDDSSLFWDKDNLSQEFFLVDEDGEQEKVTQIQFAQKRQQDVQKVLMQQNKEEIKTPISLEDYYVFNTY